MKDITGQRFGRLVALTPTKHETQPELYWVCQCDCGKQIVTSGSWLRLGRSRSCGCLTGDVGVARLRENEWKDGTSLCGLTAKTPITNKSGRKGVWFNKKTGKYEAHIQFKKKQKYLGSYYAIEDAIKARERAEKELYEPILNEYGRTLYDNKIPNERMM